MYIIKKYINIFLILILLTSCAEDENLEIGRSNYPINIELKREAKDIFGDKLESERSYQSFSSNDVVYKISARNLSMEQFISYKDQILPEKVGFLDQKLMKAIYFAKVLAN